MKGAPMNPQSDPVCDYDLCAYVDGQLDPLRRLEVEDFLARNPDAAAAVMADLHSNNAIRLAMAGGAAPRDDSLVLARQIDRRLMVRKLSRAVPKAAFVTMAAAVVWLGHDELGEILAPPSRAAIPDFADEALDTHAAARIRQTLVSEVKDKVVDGGAIRAATQIVFPAPPREWRILDSRLVPSDEGPGLQISFDKGDGVPVTFFAVRTSDEAPDVPIAAERNGETVAYWRKGPIGYALAGAMAPAELADMARDLADNPMN